MMNALDAIMIFCKEHEITYGKFQLLEHFGYVKVGRGNKIIILKKFA